MKPFSVLLVWLTILLGQCRIGEAAHPGPNPSAQWSIAAVNPTGLSGKASILNSFDPGIYGVSETHLAAPGIARFKAELAQTGSKFKLSHGAPAPTKTASLLSTGGKHTGVGFLTSYPVRPIVTGWDSELWNTSRIHAAHFLVNQTWVTGGIAYGWAFQSESSQVKANTEALLQQLSSQVLMHPGPKFICGDFNQHPKAMQETKIWENLGWIEIQDWAYRRHGINQAFTCKGTSQKDFLYISPELQQCIAATYVQQDIFADHAVLKASFQSLSHPEVIHSWPKAKSIQLTEQQRHNLQIQDTSKTQTANPTDKYRALCGKYEQAVDDLLHRQNLKPLDHNQKGRGTVVDRIPTNQGLHPVKPSRHGEPTCEISSPTLKQKQWFVQLRRITNLRRLLSHELDRPSAIQHANALWRAILRARGFKPNFRLWWTQQVRCSQVQHSLLPTQVPTYALISQVEKEFEKSYHNMESNHKKQWAEEQFRRHKADANAVFRSVRDQGPEPVETLLQTVSATVTEVVDAGAIIVDDSSQFDKTLPVLGGSWPLHLDMHEDNQMWFEEEHDLVEGQTITQQQPQGTYTQLFEAFTREWTARWDKHREIPDDHWDVLVGFIKTAFSPDKLMQCEPITRKEWDAELHKKPKHAATGMDGVSVQDLRNMPDSLVEELLCLFDQIETTGDWPEQLVHGAIHSLQKVPNACRVSQFRPITILPVAYRMWSSIRCKQLIRHLQQFAPPGIYGNVTGKSATAMWYELQMQVEVAQWEAQPLTGAIADIVKAFNCLPRMPILIGAVQLGVDQRIVRPWTSMLTRLTRHFVIRKSYSPGLKSTTGLAEGCGLSVAGMMITNIIMHRYMAIRSPNIAMLSYVDNWEMNANTVEEVTEGMQHLEQFCTLWDLQLDQNKTVYWSINSAARQTMRQADLAVVTSCRDLGGHMQFTKQKTNRTLAEKSEAIKKLWPRLHSCRSPLRHKFKVLRCKAWPRVLHSCPGVHVNDHILTNLRSGAMQGLGLSKSGANPMIQLSWLLFPTHDPECYAIFSSVRHARRFANSEAIEPYLKATSMVPERQHMPGPIGVLISRLATLGWQYGTNGIFYDLHGIPIDVFRGPFQAIASKMAFDWQQFVGRQMQQRHGFEGAQDVAPFFMAKSCKKLSDHEKGVIRAATNGTFFTEDFLGKIHGDPRDEWKCPLCSQPDSIQHRYWECSETKELREKIPENFRQFLENQPPITKHRGWMTQPPAWIDFQKSLLQIPDSTDHFQRDHEDSFQDAFTDGTGIDPTQPQSRLVAWAWVMGRKKSQNFFPMAEGGVPGTLQTIGRAELTAVISVLKYVSWHRCKVRIWVDNQYVFGMARRMQVAFVAIDPMQPDHDMWEIVQTYMQYVAELVSFHKVCSHQKIEQLESVDQWICQGNEMADQQATLAIDNLPTELKRLQKEVSQQVDFRQQASTHLVKHIIDIGQIFTQQPKTTKSEPVASSVEDAVPVDTRAIVRTLQDRLPQSFSFPGVNKWLDWFDSLTDPHAAVKWITWHELLISYQLHTGQRGVRCHNITSGNHRQWGQLTLQEEYDFPQVSRFFGHYCQQIIKRFDQNWKSSMRRPSNWRFQMWCGCVPLRFSKGHEEAVQSWLASQVASSTFVSIKSMAQLPQAAELAVGSTGKKVGLWKYVR